MGLLDSNCPRSGDTVLYNELKGIILRPQGIGGILVEWSTGKTMSINGHQLEPVGQGVWELTCED
jgi:hypothetical protein